MSAANRRYDPSVFQVAILSVLVSNAPGRTRSPTICSLPELSKREVLSASFHRSRLCATWPNQTRIGHPEAQNSCRKSAEFTRPLRVL